MVKIKELKDINDVELINLYSKSLKKFSFGIGSWLATFLELLYFILLWLLYRPLFWGFLIIMIIYIIVTPSDKSYKIYTEELKRRELL